MFKALFGTLGLGLGIAAYASAVLVVNEPAAIVYDVPEEDAHIEDIVRYGTKVDIIEDRGEWAHVSYPGNEGWVTKEELLDVEQDPELNADAFVGIKGAYFFRVPDTEWGFFFTLPFEAPLQVIEELPQGHQRWLLVKLQDGQLGYVQRSQITMGRNLLSVEDLPLFSQQFIGLKYMWGGTTSFGYDCSGFVQMLFRQAGVTIPRNSSQQAQDPQFTQVNAADAKAGDLVFFKNSSGKVTHVGMMISSTQFIHSFTRQESWICLSDLADERFTNGYFYYGKEIRRLNSKIE